MRPSSTNRFLANGQPEKVKACVDSDSARSTNKDDGRSPRRRNMEVGREERNDDARIVGK